VTSFFNKELMKTIPSKEAERYGDSTFALIMMAKVICVQLVVDLGYDVLFQDVDLIWLKDPRTYFEGSLSGEFDVYFQDDGNRQERFAPYSVESRVTCNCLPTQDSTLLGTMRERNYSSVTCYTAGI